MPAPHAENAPRQGTQTPPPPPSTRFIILRNLGILILIAASVELNRLCLSPVYDAIPSPYSPSWEINILSLVFVTNTEFGPRLQSLLRDAVPTLGCAIPVILSLSFGYSKFMGPRWGPLFTSLGTSLPLMYLSMLNVLSDLISRLGDSYPDLFNIGPYPSVPPLIFLWTALYMLRRLATLVLQLCINSSTTGPTFTRFGLQILLSLVYSAWAFRKKHFWVLLFLIPTLSSLHVPTERNNAKVNAILRSEGYSLVARQESVTGYISVIDNVNEGFRVMRCDHSLLGGEWLQQPHENHSNGLKDPVYAVFVMLEAVRLVETDAMKQEIAVPDVDKTALVIGLGIGTSASALLAHGINTTTIEIDPLIHAYATNYFSLSTLSSKSHFADKKIGTHNVILADAIPTVNFLLKEFPTQTYDYIIHDVFTGGIEPLDLFTTEFLTNLSGLLRPERGVIAVNYAGNLNLGTSRAVIKTVLNVFPLCRVFRESEAATTSNSEKAEGSQDEEDFTNLIFFCLHPSTTPDSETAFSFRDPVEADFLQTVSRREILVPKHEISVSALLSSLSVDPSGDGVERSKRNGTDTEDDLVTVQKVRKGKYASEQDQGRQGHWKVMRGVLQDVVWENW